MMNDRRGLVSVKILLAVGTVSLVVPLMGACSKTNTKMQMPPVPVVVAEAANKTLPFEITAIGTGEAYNTASIVSQVNGMIKRVYFTDGQQTKKGDPLFLIDPAPYKAALAAAEAKLARDQATARNLEASVKRYDDLVKKEYITPQEHSDMLTSLEAMKATVRSDDADVDGARLDLEHCTITAPLNGRMGTRLIDEGNVVKVNSDNPMVLIHQIQPMYVRFSVPEKYLTDILKYFASDTLAVRASAPDDPPSAHMGRLTFVDNTVDAATGTILLKAEFPNEDMLLWPGEFVNVVLVLRQLENAVVVPSQAIGTGQKGDYLFVVKSDATVEMRAVSVAYRLDNDAVIESGLAAGEKVVTDGQLRLRPGAKIVEKTPVAGDRSNSQ